MAGMSSIKLGESKHARKQSEVCHDWYVTQQGSNGVFSQPIPREESEKKDVQRVLEKIQQEDDGNDEGISHPSGRAESNRKLKIRQGLSPHHNRKHSARFR
jgi:predicted naringenin-chalcone synthase